MLPADSSRNKLNGKPAGPDNLLDVVWGNHPLLHIYICVHLGVEGRTFLTGLSTLPFYSRSGVLLLIPVK